MVCKLTFQLAPGEATLSKHHDPIYERDEFPNEDRDAPLFAPSDLVPERPRVDVSLVGAAYAPGGVPVQALPVRLAVGSIDKRLVVGSTEVHGSEATGSFRSAELTYGYGPTDGRNPWPGRDAAGGGHRIEVPQEHVSSGAIPGFGPIAAHWSSRRERLGDHEPPELRDAGVACELGEGFELGFFNAAPTDQQLEHLDPNAELVLENLHPEIPSLHTRFPNVVPQVFVERAGRREEIEGRIASLWIDARRGAATLTWQTLVPLRSVDEKGRIWVAVAGPGRRLTPDQLTKLIGTLQHSLGGSQPSTVTDEPTEDGAGGVELSRDTVSIQPVRADELPRVGRDGPEDTKTSMFSQEHLEAEMLDRTQDPSLADTGTGIGILSQKNDGMPNWMRGRTGPPPPPRRDKNRGSTPAPGSVVPTPASPRRRRLDANTTFHGLGPRPEWPREEKARFDTASIPLGAEARRLAQTAPPPGHSAAKLDQTAPPPGQPAAKLEQTAPPPGQPAAPPVDAPPSSLASAPAPPVSAVGFPPPRPPQPSLAMPAPPKAEPAQPKPKPKKKPRVARVPSEVVEMLWFDDDATALLRQRFRRLCNELDFSPPDERHDRPASEGKRAQDHHVHFGILTQVTPDDGRTLKDTMRAAVSETGRFTPPMVVLKGELTMSFEDTDRLRATAAVVKPIVGDDKKLKAALEQVDELLATPLMSGSNEPVRNILEHLRKVYGQTKRTLTLDYLNETVERGLLEQRQYARRKLFGGEVIRGELSVGDKHRVVVYLPEALERQLPLMTSFEARLVAEAHLRQDQFESHPHALKVVTLGRVHRLDR